MKINMFLGSRFIQITAISITILIWVFILFSKFWPLNEVKLDQGVAVIKGSQIIDSNEKNKRYFLSPVETNKKGNVNSRASIEFKNIYLIIDNLSKRLNNLENSNESLRNSINPFKPDEILLVARLKDQITILQDDIKGYKNILQQNIDSFKNSIIRELEYSRNLIYLIFVSVIPLIFNSIISIIKGSKGEELQK